MIFSKIRFLVHAAMNPFKLKLYIIFATFLLFPFYSFVFSAFDFFSLWLLSSSFPLSSSVLDCHLVSRFCRYHSLFIIAWYNGSMARGSTGFFQIFMDITIIILDIIHHSVFYLKHDIWDWIWSPSSGGTFSVGARYTSIELVSIPVLAQSVDPIWVGSTWRRRQNPVSNDVF
jgi:hypothetical protein